MSDETSIKIWSEDLDPDYDHSFHSGGMQINTEKLYKYYS